MVPSANPTQAVPSQPPAKAPAGSSGGSGGGSGSGGGGGSSAHEGTASERLGTPWESKESALKTVNKRVQVWWDEDRCYYKGMIVMADKNGRVKIRYDDKQVQPTP